MPCLSYTLHCTPYTENKKYFLCFFLYLPKGIYLCLFTIFPRPRAYLIYIHAKPTRRQASKQPQALNALAPIHAKHKQPSGYTREAYTPSGYTLRLRLYTPYTAAASISGHTASRLTKIFAFLLKT